MTAITLDSRYGFVTISGDGLIQGSISRSAPSSRKIAVSSPLAGGGYTTVVQPGIPPVDLWAR